MKLKDVLKKLNRKKDPEVVGYERSAVYNEDGSFATTDRYDFKPEDDATYIVIGNQILKQKLIYK